MKIKIFLKVICIIMLLFCINGNIVLSNKGSVDYHKKDKLIIDKIKVGTHNTSKGYVISRKFLKEILCGAWDVSEYDGVDFYTDGTFKVTSWEFIEKGELLYKGRWRTEDNAIIFKVGNSNKWQKCLIKKIIFEKNKKSYIKYDYWLEIIFDKVSFNYKSQNRIFLGGDIHYQIYLEKEDKVNKKKNETKKQVPKKKK